MKEEFDIPEFEQFLQDEVNNHKLYPSDAVWDKIAKEIQPKKSWPALSIIAFLIVGALTITTLLNYPAENILAKLQFQDSLYKLQIQQHQQSIQEHTNDNLEKRTAIANITAKTLADIHQQKIANSAVISADTKTTQEDEIAVVTNTSTDKQNTTQTSEKINLYSELLLQQTQNLQRNMQEQASNSTYFIEENAVPKLDTLFVHETDQMVNNIRLQSKELSKNNNSKIALLRKKLSSTKKWSYEIYATPSVSYRKLEDDKERNNFIPTNPNAPLAPNITNSVNNLVRHKPALGTEIGVGFIYEASPIINIKAGLQFNIRQYYIDAFKSSGVATFAIIQNNRLDSLSVYTRYGNNAGNIETMLDNKLYQLSIPVGIELKLLQGKRFGINTGFSIQPTLTLNKNAYIISTDYKYYADAEPFFRQLNINSSVDVNISYQFKRKKIYIGPQIRYQHLPTYSDLYPIKEFRWDYGVRIGIVQPF